jgi:hypothetical protein
MYIQLSYDDKRDAVESQESLTSPYLEKYNELIPSSIGHYTGYNTNEILAFEQGGIPISPQLTYRCEVIPSALSDRTWLYTNEKNAPRPEVNIHVLSNTYGRCLATC